MTDIVERLLNYRSGVVSVEYGVPLEVCVAAADEIKRLREAIEFAHSEGFEWPSDPLPAWSVSAPTGGPNGNNN